MPADITHPHMGDLERLDLTARDGHGLEVIVEVYELDPLHRPASHTDLLAELSARLNVEFTNNEQARRIVEKLRRAGLVDPDKSRLIPTAKGRQLYRSWYGEVAWRKRGATRK